MARKKQTEVLEKEDAVLSALIDEENLADAKINHILDDVVVPSIRNDNRLLNSVNYTYDKYGFIDYKKLIPQEYFVLNRWNYAKNGVDIDLLSEEEKAAELLKAKEEDLLILLRGFKEVARIRGYTSIDSEIVHYSNLDAVVKVTINWLPNIETGFEPLKVSCVKSASVNEPSINQDFVHYLPAIAENRAFVTVVRNSLNIPIIGRDEIVDKKVEVKVASPKPNKFLEELCNKKGISFGMVLEHIEQEQLAAEIDASWVNFDKLPNGLSGALLHSFSKES